MLRPDRAPGRRHLFIYPLMDMFFILLIFYFVAAGSGQPVQRFAGLPRPTGTGKINTVIQIVDAKRFLWLDEDAIAGYDEMGGNRERFLESVTVGPDSLRKLIGGLLTKCKVTTAPHYSVFVRCHDTVSYGSAIQVLELITGQPDDTASIPRNLRLSLAAGGISDLMFKRGRDEETEYLELYAIKNE